MKTISALPFLFFLLLSQISYSQYSQENVIISPFWDFYSTNYLNGISSGKGNTGVASDNDISGSALNPATLNLKSKYSLNIQYTYKTSQPWLPNLAHGFSIKENLPFSGSISFGYKINKQFSTGFIYSNPASFKYGGTIIRTDEFGNEIGTYEMYDNYTLHSFSVPFVYNTPKFSAGINLTYSIYHRYIFPIYNITVSETDYTETLSRFNGQLGVLFKPVTGFSFGATVTPGFNADVPSGINAAASTVVKFPWKAGFGIEYTLAKPNIKFSADYHFENTSVITYLRDRHDVNIGVEYMINKTYTLRGGFFTLFDYRNRSLNFTDPAGSYDQYFLTFGGSVNIKMLQINASILDSHISSGLIKNTYVNIGLTSNF